MTDNTDLLGSSEPEPLPVKRPRGRPRKNPLPPVAPVSDVVPVIPPAAVTDAEPAPLAPAPDVVAPADSVDPATAALLAQDDADRAKRKEVEALLGDALLPPAPVSTEFAAAQASRIQLIGQAKREYAYQRVMRSGKRL